MCNILNLASSTQHTVFEVHPHCSVLVLHSFSGLNNIPLSVLNHDLVHSPIDGHLASFHLVALVSNDGHLIVSISSFSSLGVST